MKCSKAALCILRGDGCHSFVWKEIESINPYLPSLVVIGQVVIDNDNLAGLYKNDPRSARFAITGHRRAFVNNNALNALLWHSWNASFHDGCVAMAEPHVLNVVKASQTKRGSGNLTRNIGTMKRYLFIPHYSTCNATFLCRI